MWTAAMTAACAAQRGPAYSGRTIQHKQRCSWCRPPDRDLYCPLHSSPLHVPRCTDLRSAAARLADKVAESEAVSALSRNDGLRAVSATSRSVLDSVSKAHTSCLQGMVLSHQQEHA